MKKKLLSLLLAGMMVIGMLPVAASAAEDRVTNQIARDGTETAKSSTEVTDESGLTEALKSAKPGDTVTVTAQSAISLNDTVTVPSGVTLNVGDYLINKGTVEVKQGATLAVASDSSVNGEAAQEIVGPDTLFNDSGSILVTFADGEDTTYDTTITIPEGTKAEIKGTCWNNTGKDDYTYRLPKSDGMIVKGTLYINHDTTIGGKLVIENDGAVTVDGNNTLNIGKDYNAKGELTVMAGATLKAGEDQLIGENSINLTSGTAAVTFGEYSAENGTYDTAITLKGDAEAKDSGVWSKDALTVESGTLTISSEFNVKGPMTVSKGATVVVAEKGALNLCYSTGVTAPQGTLQTNGTVTVRNGGKLHVNEYGATGTINVEAGATVLVADADHGDDNQDEEMIGSGSLKITKGTAAIAFAEAGTDITIPADCEAEIAGTFMDDDAYRLPKSDGMTVEGKLTVKGAESGSVPTGMEVTGTLKVANQGIVAVKSGELELVTTKSGAAKGSLNVEKDASVEVKASATLNIENGTINVNGKVYKEEGATLTDPQNQLSSEKVVENAKELTFTFKPNGGTFADGTSTDKTITTLAHPSTKAPDVTRDGYTFNGWSGLSADGTYTEDATFTAQWSSNGGSTGGGGTGSTSYTVTVGTFTNGKVTANPTSAANGDKVTLTVAPAEGYELGALTVKDASGKSVSTTKVSATQYTFVMPEGNVTVSATFVLMNATPFADIKTTDWWYEAVKYVYENKLMAGTSTTTFAPKAKLNRAQAVQILYNLEGQPAVTGTADFTDTAAAGDWAVKAITWGSANGVVAGVGNGKFDPAANVTREQFAQMMYNYAKYKGYDLSAAGDLNNFSDVSKVSDWAKTALSWANGEGLINGNENGTLNPVGTAIRGEAASIMSKFDQNVAK